jgi:Tol biopolymer transport system component
VTITIAVRAPIAAGTISNTASVTSSVSDPNASNNTTSASSVVIAGCYGTERVSLSSSEVQGNGDTVGWPGITPDGRYVAFASGASNLVSGDTNGVVDVFVRDRQLGTTERISVSSSGGQGNGDSRNPAISADGRYVAFPSLAANLVAGDSNGAYDIFVHDRQTGATERVSVDSAGVQGNSTSLRPAISANANGRYVVFRSFSNNLVTGDTNGMADIFMHDRQTGITDRMSVDSVGVQSNGHSGKPVINTDGRYVAFPSDGSNLVSGDTNGVRDIFVHDRQTGVTVAVSVGVGGVQGDDLSRNPAISDDGRYVAFSSPATNLDPPDTNGMPDSFVHDRDSDGNGIFDETGGTTTERVSLRTDGAEANGDSRNPTIGSDGRHAAFHSFASNMVNGDTNGLGDIFNRDRVSALSDRVSVPNFPDQGTLGTQGNGHSYKSTITTDGRRIAYESEASNLVLGDTAGRIDVFVCTR